ncbi:MAG: hypothetical protein ACTHJQ_13080 [Rhizobiaceae bacterium]
MKKVLAIGLDPKQADLSQFPELSAEIVASYIKQQIDRVGELGFEVVDCLITPDDAGRVEVERVLRLQQFDCVVIGAGLREPPDLFLLFEKVINAVHRLAPQASICFNSSPADTAEAVRRWVEP